MTRRFQFSLRAMLGLAALVCLSLGGWQLLHSYGNYMEVSDLAVGRPIRVKVRSIRVLGPPRRWLQVVATNVGPLGSQMGSSGSSSQMGWASRSWLCFYEFEFVLDPINTPGRWNISAGEGTGMVLVDEQFKTFDMNEKQGENYP